MKRPNMRYEILDALEEFYKNDEEVLVDCLRALEEDDRVFEMGYCPNCGAKLISVNYREYHSEVDDWEELAELVCPECDFLSGDR